MVDLSVVGERFVEALAERLQLLGAVPLIATRSPVKVPESYHSLPLNDMLMEADIVSLHIPGGSETTSFIGKRELELMKSSAWLINASRGSVVDEEALYQALFRGKIAGAVLDVRESEPPLPGKLEGLPTFFSTPHLAAFTQRSQSRVNQYVFSGVSAALKKAANQNALHNNNPSGA